MVTEYTSEYTRVNKKNKDDKGASTRLNKKWCIKVFNPSFVFWIGPTIPIQLVFCTSGDSIVPVGSVDYYSFSKQNFRC